MTSAAQIVAKLWDYCNVLRDDGLSYADFVEQLTYRLFLKMADERTRPPFNQNRGPTSTPRSRPTRSSAPTWMSS